MTKAEQCDACSMMNTTCESAIIRRFRDDLIVAALNEAVEGVEETFAIEAV